MQFKKNIKDAFEQPNNTIMIKVRFLPNAASCIHDPNQPIFEFVITLSK